VLGSERERANLPLGAGQGLGEAEPAGPGVLRPVGRGGCLVPQVPGWSGGRGWALGSGRLSADGSRLRVSGGGLGGWGFAAVGSGAPRGGRLAPGRGGGPSRESLCPTERMPGTSRLPPSRAAARSPRPFVPSVLCQQLPRWARAAFDANPVRAGVLAPRAPSVGTPLVGAGLGATQLPSGPWPCQTAKKPSGILGCMRRSVGSRSGRFSCPSALPC